MQKMSETDSNLTASYHRATNEDTGETSDTAVLLERSTRGRLTVTTADNDMNPYKLSKLKFVACSRLSVDAVDKVEDTGDIFKQLKIKYGGDSEKADSVLKVMLRASGVIHNSESGTSLSLSEIDDDSDEEFQWRTSLIVCSDKAVRRRSVPQLVDHVYDVYNIDKTKDHFSSESPLPLFDHMIKQQILKREREGDLKKIEKFFHFCKALAIYIATVISCYWRSERSHSQVIKIKFLHV